jgi:NAD(P)-dependent dehydrogenase (short-subunit alcohol dehydrogenase family)
MSSPFDLTGKTILITGASSGIGRQCCVTAAALGATIVANGRNPDRLKETAALLTSGAHLTIPADLTDAVQLGELVGKLPPLDGVVHSAGVQKYLPLKFITDKALREMMIVNYEAPVLLTQGLLKQKLIKPAASIVFIASLAALAAVKGNAAYSSSKAALIAAARVMALELVGQRIRVNCIAPGMVRTPMAEQMAAVVSAEEMAEHEKMYPLGFGTPEDVASAVVFLLSDAGRWITGQTLIMDGGFSCD